MNVLIDMNLSPAWIPHLEGAGHAAIHWSQVGAPTATDHTLLAWAKTHGYVVFTHDLDFGAILAATGEDSPSVIQLRLLDISPASCAPLLLAVVDRFADYLEVGAIISVDPERSRARILPLTE